MEQCKKCDYQDPLGKDLKLINKVKLCSVCGHFAPTNNREFEEYINEKVDGNVLESFRKFIKPKDNLKKAMIEKAKSGNIVSRPPFGYKMEDGSLVAAENFDEVREIFEEFADNSSLNQIARNHNMSVNGIKKILRNFTYIGKVKFDNQILQGNHKPIISSELFNRVQEKFEDSNKK